MYSVVLAAMLTTGPAQAPAWHGCWSCSNCYGNCYGSCYGNYGIDGYNCWGSCWGSCNGCWGEYYNCTGSCTGSLYPWDWSSVGCNGCLGTYGPTSPYFVEPPPPLPPAAAPPTKPGEPLPPPGKTDDKKPETAAPNRARLIVEVPADAKLYIDDQAMKTPGASRTYQTPDLEPGQTYFYDVRVEADRDGKTVSETRRVVVKAGQEVHADFMDMTATATAKAK